MVHDAPRVVSVCRCVGQVEGLSTAVLGLESSHASSLGLCVRHIEEHVEEACAVREPSGGTPEKKAYPRPEKFRYGGRVLLFYRIHIRIVLCCHHGHARIPFLALPSVYTPYLTVYGPASTAEVQLNM